MCCAACFCGVLSKAHQAHTVTKTWWKRLAEFADADQQGWVTKIAHAMQNLYTVCTLVAVDFHAGNKAMVLPSQIFRRKEFYVGSTFVGIHARQDARALKFRQLWQNQNTSCELALHWMLSRNAFHDYIIVPVTSSGDQRACRTLESVLIQRWRPRLNFPLILKLGVTKPEAAVSSAVLQGYMTHGTRLAHRLRKHLYARKVLDFYDPSLSQQSHMWAILNTLSHCDSRAFDMSKQLRSLQFSLEHCYCLCRLAANMDEPPRSRVRASLAKVINFKGGVKPPNPKVLSLPVLAHPQFLPNVRGLLKDLVVKSKPWLIPFHLPKCKVVAAQHPSLQQMLYNHFDKMSSWNWEQPPPCLCRQALARNLSTTEVDGHRHVASPASFLSVSHRLRELLAHNAGAQVYRPWQDYCEQSWRQVSEWCQHHHLALFEFEQWRGFLLTEWGQHLKHAKVPWTMADVKYIKFAAPGLVFHGRGHAVSHCHIFCPWLYRRVLLQTFGDREVYRTMC